MQRTYLILIVLWMAMTVTACGIQSEARKGRIGKLTDKEQKTLEAINQNVNDHIAMREDAVYKFAAIPVSSKAQKMSVAIRSKCSRSGQIPEKDSVGSLNDQTIKGDDCPIYWYRQRGITSNGRQQILSVKDRLDVKDDAQFADFAKTSELKHRYANGAITASRNGLVTTISGSIESNGFEIEGIGAISYSIRTNQTWDGDEGQAWIQITVTSAAGQNSGWIDWTMARGTRNKVKFIVDNTQVEEKDFNRLFSSYELGKIMDSSELMK